MTARAIDFAAKKIDFGERQKSNGSALQDRELQDREFQDRELQHSAIPGSAVQGKHSPSSGFPADNRTGNVATDPSANVVSELPTMAQIVERHGPWSAMSIQLPDGSYTMDVPQPDRRLRRILRCCLDLSPKPISEMRILDLACLEGQYGLELAMHGAREVIGVDIREGNLEKSRFVARQFNLTNIQFIEANVLDLSREKIGTFDLVICSGIFYHIHQDSLESFAHTIADLCDHLTILDTFVSSKDVEAINCSGRRYYGRTYVEHDESTTIGERISDVWASVHNTTSFWLTQQSLLNMLNTAGYTSILRQELPTMAGTSDDRRTYVAIKGSQKLECRSSAETNNVAEEWLEESTRQRLHPRNQNHSMPRRVFTQAVRRVMPTQLKKMVRPLLVRTGVLPDDFNHIKRARNGDEALTSQLNR